MSWSGSLKAAFAITFFAGFFQLVGFILPWWFVIGDSIYIGIWFIVGCASGIANPSNCSVVAYSGLDALTNINTNDGNTMVGNIIFTIIQIVATVGFGFMLISFLSLMFSGCAAICILAVVGFFAWIYTSILIAFSAYQFDARTFPWSVAASGLGGVLTFIGAIVLAVALCSWRNEYDDDDDERHLPMSTMNDKRGYDNPRYMNERGGGYDGNHSYPRKEYPPYQPNTQPPYRNDNMYRPYHQKY
ncbi:hypothetical protein KUTeg_003918 [Tegillarca granosa]|uniref:Uncharacterized protein n=1 Tax=Tegillarca granosa TaxID=220873 RepID=A0ABQ9FQB1_TEGGR|nr:hypothetical protein KUTeg_003918 [Tegillarca granosa]